MNVNDHRSYSRTSCKLTSDESLVGIGDLNLKT